ncbi:MAG: class I SAM-dependent methyltransferase [Deltaproteobacteria bacterium]|nr:class I SAM-dependent methyltransferase [Deltaproteobacteria bacterium]
MDEILKNAPLSAIDKPAELFLYLLALHRKARKKICVAEIGIGVGATTKEIMALLSADDALYIFDYEKTIDDFLRSIDRNAIKPAFHPLGNSDLIYDSYAWPLAKLALKTREDPEADGLFDLVYLDGAHTLLHDAAACAIVKTLMRPGGFILFDDMTWRISHSPTRNPAVRPESLGEYTQEQRDSAQVAMVVDILMRTDPGFEEIESPTWRQSLFRKKI